MQMLFQQIDHISTMVVMTILCLKICEFFYYFSLETEFNLGFINRTMHLQQYFFMG